MIDSSPPQPGGLTLAEGFTELLPKLTPALSALTGQALCEADVSCGRFGCVLVSRNRKYVVKVTGDPTEFLGWLYLQEKQRQAQEPFLAGAVHIYGVWKVRLPFPGMFGTTHMRTFGVALVERVIPGHRRHHRGTDRRQLRLQARGIVTQRHAEPIPSIDRKLTELYEILCRHDKRALKRLCDGAPSALADLCRFTLAASRAGVWFEDVELHNVGWRLRPGPPSLVLFDIGRVRVPSRLKARLTRAWSGLRTHKLTVR